MKREPAISIIIPMYNLTNYIGFCMDSIFNQTFKDYEVILIDDLSSDGTYELCQREYGHLDNVKVLKNTSNMGAGLSRNKGFEIAAGKYVYFMDGDDELLPEALAFLYHKAEEEKADIVHNNYYYSVYTEGRMLPRKTLWEGMSGRDTTEGVLGGTRVERMRWQWRTAMPMPWLKLCRREFMEREKIRFVNLPFADDNVFSVTVALKAERFVCVNKMLNLYRLFFDQKGRMERRSSKAFSMAVDKIDELNKVFDDCSEEEFPFEERLSFITPWLRAHLKFCVFDIMRTREEKSFASLVRNMEPAMGNGKWLGALLIHLLGEDSHAEKWIMEERKKQRENFKKIFGEFDAGSSKRVLDHAYVYSQARRAVEVEGGEDSYYLRIYEYMGTAALHLGRYEEAMEAYGKAVKYTETGSDDYWRISSKWGNIISLLELNDEEVKEKCGEYISALEGVRPLVMGREKNGKSGKTRLGVLTDCFCRHELFASVFGLIFCYDKKQFEVYCYHVGRLEDDFTDAIRSQADGFVNVAELSCRQVAERIRNDGVEVLIDLTGYGLADALPVFAYRPASMQIGGPARLLLGGSVCFDYILTDDVINFGTDNGMGLWTLPCAYSYAMRDDIPPSRRAPVMERGFITFGVVAHYYQINDNMLALWREILEKLPDARLVVRTEEFVEKAMIVETEERLSSLGFDMGRVLMEGALGDSLPRYLDMDILLCPYPSIPCGKLLDALYMGVPAVTMYGAREDTRLGLSILSRVGLENLAVDSLEKYVAQAISLANDRDKLDDLHKTLRKKLESAKALNPAKYVRTLEMRIRERCL